MLNCLFEARKNPQLNPPTNINKIISDALDRAVAKNDILGEKTHNAFVSFTDIEKLGINPSSRYKTPIGIYSYPADYVMDEIGLHEPMSKLPFAGNAPFVNVFTARGNIIDIGAVTDNEVNQYYSKLRKIFDPKLVDNLIDRSIDEARYSDCPGGRLWFVTMHLSNFDPVKWNKIFRSIGIDGCIDGYGSSIIHPAEPTQAVFFSIKAIANNKIYDNKTPKRDYEIEYTRKHRLDQLATIRNAVKDVHTVEDFEKVKKQYYGIGLELIRGINNSQLKNEILKKFPNAIEFLHKPSEMQQTIAFTSDPNSIAYVPTEKISIKAVIAGLNTSPQIWSENEGLIDWLVQEFATNIKIMSLILPKQPTVVENYIDIAKKPSKELIQIAINNYPELPPFPVLKVAKQLKVDTSPLRGKTNFESRNAMRMFKEEKQLLKNRIQEFKRNRAEYLEEINDFEEQLKKREIKQQQAAVDVINKYINRVKQSMEQEKQQVLNSIERFKEYKKRIEIFKV